jgi:hypothetical protein
MKVRQWGAEKVLFLQEFHIWDSWKEYQTICDLNNRLDGINSVEIIILPIEQNIASSTALDPVIHVQGECPTSNPG